MYRLVGIVAIVGGFGVPRRNAAGPGRRCGRSVLVAVLIDIVCPLLENVRILVVAVMDHIISVGILVSQSEKRSKGRISAGNGPTIVRSGIVVRIADEVPRRGESRRRKIGKRRNLTHFGGRLSGNRIVIATGMACRKPRCQGGVVKDISDFPLGTFLIHDERPEIGSADRRHGPGEIRVGHRRAVVLSDEASCTIIPCHDVRCHVTVLNGRHIRTGKTADDSIPLYRPGHEHVRNRILREQHSGESAGLISAVDIDVDESEVPDIFGLPRHETE